MVGKDRLLILLNVSGVLSEILNGMPCDRTSNLIFCVTYKMGTIKWWATEDKGKMKKVINLNQEI